MKTYTTFPIDKKDLCDSGCLRMAIYGVAVSHDGVLQAEIKLCSPDLQELLSKKEYQAR